MIQILLYCSKERTNKKNHPWKKIVKLLSHILYSKKNRDFKFRLCFFNLENQRRNWLTRRMQISPHFNKIVESLMVEGKFGVCNGITRVNDVKSGWVTLGLCHRYLFIQDNKMTLFLVLYQMINYCNTLLIQIGE